MERGSASSPVSNSNSPSLAASSPPSSPTPSDIAEQSQQQAESLPRPKKKSSRKTRKVLINRDSKASNTHNNNEADHEVAETTIIRKHKKAKHRRKNLKELEGKSTAEEGRPNKKPRKQPRNSKGGSTSAQHDREGGLSAAQIAVNEQMRKALAEDQYSANGSIVDTDSDEDDQYMYRGQTVRMDRTALMAAMRKHLWMERLNGAAASSVVVSSTTNSSHAAEDDEFDEGNETRPSRSRNTKKKKKGKRNKEEERMLHAAGVGGASDVGADGINHSADITGHESAGALGVVDSVDDDYDRDGGSIFGQTTGSSNSTWVECDKCKKWRRLRGVVDEKKLPSKWYCSMNKNDPERARCSAPEEEYDPSTHTPESAADARSRKHLRVWVRRLQCNEAYESRQPTLTRGKKRAATTSSKEPYEWVRCCNPSCGKWRAILRIMDAKSSVIDRTTDGEWYCVMNTWDEKTASCAAPQENLPAIGCPLWVIQDEE